MEQPLKSMVKKLKTDNMHMYKYIGLQFLVGSAYSVGSSEGKVIRLTL